jgi:hypothetical protein
MEKGMGSSSGVDGVEDGAEVFGCHEMFFFYRSEQGEAEEDVSKDPERNIQRTDDDVRLEAW